MEKSNALKQKETSSLWKRIEDFAVRQPKKTFYIMFGIIFCSLVFSIGNLIYIEKVAVPEYESLKKENIFKDASNSLGTPIRETEKILDIREVLKELDYYRSKKVLTASDSLRIKYLLDKYQIQNRR